MKRIIKILDKDLKPDKEGIFILSSKMSEDVILSKKAWEKIYDYDIKDLIKDREDFDKNKLWSEPTPLDTLYTKIT